MRGKAKVKRQKAKQEDSNSFSVGTTARQPHDSAQPAGDGRPRLLDRWWVALLAAAWVIGIVVVYYGLQLGRLERLSQVLAR